jgi:hypothetical protein
MNLFCRVQAKIKGGADGVTPRNLVTDFNVGQINLQQLGRESMRLRDAQRFGSAGCAANETDLFSRDIKFAG